MTTGEKQIYDIIIVGGGPTGLAAGLFAARAGLDHLVIEKETLVNTIVGYPHNMHFFSTADRLSIGNVPFSSVNFRPTREEAIVYYRNVARAEEVRTVVGETVNTVTQLEDDEEGVFEVVTSKGKRLSRTVVLATGYFDNTNRLNVPGEDLPHVHHYYREPYREYDRDVVVIGGRNSAVETALDLYRHGARVTMVHRRGELGSGVKYWVRPDIENRLNAGEINVYWNSGVVAIRESDVDIRDNESGIVTTLPADTLYAMIGYRPDERLFQSCGIEYDPETLIPVYNPETFETSVPGLFLAGSVACGCKTWEIFIENGREQARQVVEVISRRLHS